MPRISVVIPMYNGEVYIGQCIRSVQNQTYGDFEIIVVDDGSTDRGAEICRSLAAADPRIRLTCQENGGVSRARNHGIDLACGEYLFFLDCDDGIHPCLFQEMVAQAEQTGAVMLYCDCAMVDDGQMEQVCRRTGDWKEQESLCQGTGDQPESPQWQVAEGELAEEWFHIRYVRELSRVCGMVRRDCVGDLRFDQSMKNGEDTWFKYSLFSRKLRTAYTPCKWYYYRTHGTSTSHVGARNGDTRYFQVSSLIRDREYGKGQIAFAMTWENITIAQMMKNYGLLRRAGNRKGCLERKEAAAAERKGPLFSRLSWSTQILYGCCFSCYPLYVVLNRVAQKLAGWRLFREKRMERGI